MESKKKDSLRMNLLQVGIAVLFLLIPWGINYFLADSGEFTSNMMKGVSAMMLNPIILYLVNFFLLIPKFLFNEDKRMRKWFFILNVVLLFLLNLKIFFPGPLPKEVYDAIPFGKNELTSAIATASVMTLAFQSLFILLAVGIRYIIRSHQQKLDLQEAKRQSAEAELSWLKNQLNPHFLFNTLNNISSLTQIDPMKAQESIGQLSSLLRYALYESNSPLVPLEGEVEFMEDYVDLMTLRCNGLTTVRKEFILPKGNVQIAPLLFISLIENAFKHGVNSRHESFVDIRLYPDGEDLVFSSENSFFEKSGKDEIGSGIGLENMTRRLDLIYPGAYKYTCGREGDKYNAVVILKGLLSRRKLPTGSSSDSQN